MNLQSTLGQLAEAVKGKLVKGEPESPFNSFVTDTRRLRPGDFFWALKGLSYDAHDFLAQTIPLSVSGWLVREESLAARAEAGSWSVQANMKDLPPAVITVKDTLKALQDLAAWHRQRFQLHLTAITGSNGKSTTKEMLKSIFSAAGGTCSNPGNLNNQFGLPLALLELAPAHRYGVFELGASRRGDIKEIGEVASPTCGIITNIGPSHLEYFGDMETIFATKTELADCLTSGGILVYNYDDQYLSRLNDRDFPKLTFGRHPEADLRILEGEGLRIEFDGSILEVSLPYAGGHNYYNAAAAAGAAIAAGLDFAAIRKGLENYTPPPMRLQELNIKGATVVLDAYNSNPQSVASALKEMTGRPKPLYLMLGDMKELGKFSKHYHTDLGAALAHMGAEKVFLAGPEMQAAADAYLRAGGKRLAYAETPGPWLAEARELISAGKGSFLIKASRSMKFERIIEGL
ncbi:MAG: UDP-N-acetylmuramoyl-tripeptide--D-alanyl-D-alanine ligase [Elusimicrobia bacterium]|nr:UDP-N-acetylmuramoyl-tripeptide--D-alanyl-D-alanine ligase [Elusimicrobiota bacterium]